MVRIAILASTLLACFLLYATNMTLVRSLGVRDPEQVRAIAVVTTWDDLEKQPVINLGKGVQIRLGIEATSAPRWGAIQLFCLTEGYRPPSEWRSSSLGPAFVSCMFRQKEYELARREGTRKVHQGTKHLFIQSLLIHDLGPYEITILDANKRRIATTTVKGTTDFFHPWVAWASSKSPEAFTSTFATIALPCWRGFAPFEKDPGVKRPQDPLPALLPAKPTPGFTISLHGNELIIQSTQEFIISRPHSRFLSRWWINGKPCVPTKRHYSPEMIIRESVATGNKLTLPLIVDIKQFGVTKACRIGLQLLYTEAGWTECYPGAFPIGQHDRQHMIWLSNRIDFDLKSHDNPASNR